MVADKQMRQGNFIDVCSQCTTDYGCCNDTKPPITEKRRKIINDYLKNEGIVIEQPFVEEEYVFPRLDKDGYCIFHDRQTRKCIVHAVKPETCVGGPITFDINAKTGRIEYYIKKEKICRLAGLVYDDKELFRKHFDTAKKELSQLVKDLSTRALEAVLKKEEPETIKIG